MLSELLSFGYGKVFWNRRVHKGRHGAALAEDQNATSSSRLCGISFQLE
jgi:hypothetical protein